MLTCTVQFHNVIESLLMSSYDKNNFEIIILGNFPNFLMILSKQFQLSYGIKQYLCLFITEHFTCSQLFCHHLQTLLYCSLTNIFVPSLLITVAIASITGRKTHNSLSDRLFWHLSSSWKGLGERHMHVSLWCLKQNTLKISCIFIYEVVQLDQCVSGIFLIIDYMKECNFFPVIYKTINILIPEQVTVCTFVYIDCSILSQPVETC